MNARATTAKRPSARPSGTWADIRQLCFVVMLVVAFISPVAIGAWRLLGGRAAFLLMLGFVGYITVVFALITLMSLAVSYGHQWFMLLKARHDASPRTNRGVP
jgi:hypothetical protein